MNEQCSRSRGSELIPCTRKPLQEAGVECACGKLPAYLSPPAFSFPANFSTFPNYDRVYCVSRAVPPIQIHRDVKSTSRIRLGLSMIMGTGDFATRKTVDYAATVLRNILLRPASTSLAECYPGHCFRERRVSELYTLRIIAPSRECRRVVVCIHIVHNICIYRSFLHPSLLTVRHRKCGPQLHGYRDIV